MEGFSPNRVASNISVTPLIDTIEMINCDWLWVHQTTDHAVVARMIADGSMSTLLSEEFVKTAIFYSVFDDSNSNILETYCAHICAKHGKTKCRCSRLSNFLYKEPPYKKVNQNYFSKDKIDPLKFMLITLQINTNQLRINFCKLNNQIVDLNLPFSEAICKKLKIPFVSPGADYKADAFLSEKLNRIMQKSFPIEICCRD